MSQWILEMHKKNFYPDEFYKKIEDIDLNKYKDKFKAIIIDHDNTIVKRGDLILENEVKDWLKEANENFKIGIISNNRKNKFNSIEKDYNLPIIDKALKPLPHSFKKMMKILNVKNNEVILIGDQIFTDILGGNILNLHTILVEPRDKSKDSILTKIQRFFESFFWKKIKQLIML